MEPSHVFGIFGVVVGLLGLLARWGSGMNRTSEKNADAIKENLHRDLTHVRDTIDWLTQHVVKNDREMAGTLARHEEKLASAFERLAKIENDKRSRETR